MFVLQMSAISHNLMELKFELKSFQFHSEIDICLPIYAIIYKSSYLCFSPDLVKDLWAKLRREEPELLGNFEEFLARVTSDLKCTKTDYQNLETALRK